MDPLPRANWFAIGIARLSLACICFLQLGQALVLPQIAQAASAPNIVTYQGRLLNANGIPVATSSASMIFEFYTASSGGTCVWSNSSATCASATARTVTLTDGLFSENLGDTGASTPYAAIGDTIFADNAALYLQVTIGGETLSPRKQIVAAPYALNADSLDGLNSDDDGATAAAVVAYNSAGNLAITGNPSGSGVEEGSLSVNPGSAAADETVLGVASGGSELFRVDNEGDVFVTSDLTLTGGDLISSSVTFNFLDAASNSTTIDIGGVTASLANTINIATNSTAADVITIGNSNASTTVAITGGDDWSISTAGTGTFTDLSCTDCLDFTELADSLALDAATSITLDGSESLTLNNTGTGNIAVDLTSTGDFIFNVDGSAVLTVGDNSSLSYDDENDLGAGGTAINVQLNQVTSGIGLNFDANTIADGNVFDFDANGLTTGSMLNARSSAAFSGDFWQLSLSGASTGNIFAINSTSATATSTIFNIDLDNGDNNNDVFVLSSDEVTSSGTAADTTKARITASGEFFSDVGFTAGGASTRYRDGSIATTSVATFDFQDAAGASTTLDFGGVTTDLGNTINIATNSTSADVLTVGNSNASTTLALVGGDDWSIATTGAGVFDSVSIDNGSANISLESAGVDATTSGASVVGLYDEFDNSNSTTLQSALNDFDTVITGLSAGSSKWTDAGTFTYLTSTTDDVVVGDTTVAGASLFFDESAAQLDLGTDSALAGTIRLYSATAATADPTLSADTTGNLDITAAATELSGDIAVTGGDLTSASATFNFLDAAGNSTTLEIGGVTTDLGNTISIATNSTSADVLTVGNSNGSTTLALTGGDDWSIAATGVLTLSASAAATTGIVLTDTDYTNAISVGDNNIIGTTGAFDFTNFDVATTGAITVAAGVGLDTNAAGALALGNTNATSVSLCNSAACDTLSLGTNTDADTITIGEANDDISITDANWSISAAGNIVTSNDISVNGGSLNSTAATFNLLDAAADSTTIDIGGVTANKANTINIATNSTSADAITIGNSNASTTLSIVGGDDWSISSAGAASFTSFAVPTGVSTFSDDVDFAFVTDGTDSENFTLTSTHATDVGLFAFDLSFTDTAATDVNLNYLAAFTNQDDGGATGTPDGLLLLRQSDVNETVASGIEFSVGSPGVLTTAINAADTSITNALSAGANFVLFDGIRIFEGSTGTLTWEDTSGNDLLTLTDGGTTGTLNIDGGSLSGTTPTINFTNFDVASTGAVTITDTSTATQLALAGASANVSEIAVTASNSTLLLTGNRTAAAGNVTDVIVDSVATRTTGKLLEVDNNGSERFSVPFYGALTVTASAAPSGSRYTLLLTNANHTGQTASTEVSNISSTAYTRQWATGALTTQREVFFGQPTYAFVGASTITDAANVYIQGAPAAGTNATITNSYALWVDDGNVRLDADLAVNGGDFTSSSATFNFLDATGDSTTIDLGGVTTDLGNTVNIATNSTSADALTVGNSNASTTVAITGGDDWSIAATGVLTLSASAAATTAIVVTDTDYTNAISVGDNNIVGTTGAIDFTNFDVATTGATTITNTSTATQLALAGTVTNSSEIAVTASDSALLLTGNRTAAAGNVADVIIDSTATRTTGRILEVHNNGSERAAVLFYGALNITGSAVSGGSRHILALDNPNHTSQTASTEVNNISSDAYTRQWATGAITTQREVFFGQPTYAFTGASTITDAANLYVQGAPAAGTNATITNSYALWVDDGTSRFDGDVTISGGITQTSSATTGTAITATANSLTSGDLMNLSTTATGRTSASVLALISDTPTHAGNGTNAGVEQFINRVLTSTSAGTTVNVEGQLLLANQSLTVNDGGAGTAVVNYTGDLLSVVSSATETSGNITFTGTVASFDQGFSQATGTVVEISNAGTGLSLDIRQGDMDIAGDIQLGLNGTATTNGLCHSGADSDTTAVNRDIVVCSAAPDDYAEWYETESNVGHGDIVAFGDDTFTYEASQSNPFTGEILPNKVTKTLPVLKRALSGDEVFGVVSTSPNQTIGSDVKNNGAHPMPIALSGRVPVHVSDENGAIHAGDYLTISSTHGHAMKATQPGQVVGRALNDFTGSGVGTILMFVDNGWWVGTIGTDGTATTVNDTLALAPIAQATASNQAVDSNSLALRGSAWNGTAAENVEFSLHTDAASSTDYRLSIKNNAGVETAFISNEGDLAIAGRLYLSNQGTMQTDKYLYYDASGSPLMDYVRTNAAGFGTGSYDFAEMFPSPEPLAAGDVVVFGSGAEQMKRSTGVPYDDRIAGVVSTSPGFLAGNSKVGDYPIALAGRVPTKVTNENGAIAIGDPLTTSSRPGYAMKATQPGPILGYALEAMNAADGRVVAFVRASYYDGSGANQAPGANNAVSGASTAVSNLNVSGSLSMSGSILGLSSIVSGNGLWKISELGDLVTEGRLVQLVNSFQNEKVETYAAASREMTIQLSGTAKLQNGAATVEFDQIDPKFNDIISPLATYRVLVTPSGVTGQLYVAERTISGFTIRSEGSADGVLVDWLVIAYHKDYEPDEPLTEPEQPVTPDNLAGDGEQVPGDESGAGDTAIDEPTSDSDTGATSETVVEPEPEVLPEEPVADPVEEVVVDPPPTSVDEPPADSASNSEVSS